MPTKQILGRTRIDYKGDPAFIDLVKRAAGKLGLPLSSYIRLALAERLQRDGYALPDPKRPMLPDQTSRTQLRARKSK